MLVLEGHMFRNFFAVLAICLVAAFAAAEESPIDAEKLRAAITSAIPPIEAGSRGSAEKRKCFTCHSQALPILALSVAKERGFAIDEENFQRQVKHTYGFLAENKEKYEQGKGQGGNVLTAGYALWALDAAKQPKDEVTVAVSKYISGYQSGEDHWQHRGKRPPTSGSDVTATYVALRGIHTYGIEYGRIDAALLWSLGTDVPETEDHVFRMRSMLLFNGKGIARDRAQAALLALQREDGGWSQKPDMESDVYATGSVLVTLLEAGVSSDEDSIRRGVKYLLDQQKDDGTWHVKTRAIGFQEYYESGFPHGEDQFISIAASSWATWALVLALPQEK